MEVLFTLAHWHSLAKLRQHTDLSLAVLKSVTIQLGKLLRDFQSDTCAAYETRELGRETAARTCQAASKPKANQKASGPASDAAGSKNINSTSSISGKASTSTPASQPEPALSKPKKSAGKQQRTLNLNTYKDHSLGDYVESIRRYGTVDSYSTESVGFLCHFSIQRPDSVFIDRTGTPFSKITLSSNKPQRLRKAAWWY